jgi:beta-lactamase class D
MKMNAKIKKVLFILIIILIIYNILNSQDLNKFTTVNFNKYFTKFNGCFMLQDQTNKKNITYNENKCNIQISPCSTFKIIHSLIGLETKILQDENTIIKWDGTLYPISSWNKNQTLASAVSNSVVWYFQKVALKIGINNEQYYLNKINYGNKDISGGITKFWLESSLKISPKEQMDFLIKFYNNELPFSKRNIEIVKKIIILNKNNNTIISGKTGSGVIENKNVNGWFIGYIEKDKNVYYFVTNIESNDNATGLKAKEITLNILKDLKILE